MPTSRARRADEDDRIRAGPLIEVSASFIGRTAAPTVVDMDRPDGDPIETFLVERYWPDVDLAQLRAALPRLDAAAGAMAAEGRRVVHLGSILMPADHVVFSLIAATDESLVRQLNERAELPADRIARAIALAAGALFGDDGPADHGGTTR